MTHVEIKFRLCQNRHSIIDDFELWFDRELELSEFRLSERKYIEAVNGVKDDLNRYFEYRPVPGVYFK